MLTFMVVLSMHKLALMICFRRGCKKRYLRKKKYARVKEAKWKSNNEQPICFLREIYWQGGKHNMLEFKGLAPIATIDKLGFSSR